MLAATEVHHYRQRLLDLASRLDGDRSQLEDEALRPIGGEADGELSNFPVHPADVGGRSFDEDVTLGLLHNEEQLLGEINAALSRIDKGEYGVCAACRHPIGKKRLQALPYARYCVTCTKAREEG